MYPSLGQYMLCIVYADLDPSRTQRVSHGRRAPPRRARARAPRRHADVTHAGGVRSGVVARRATPGERRQRQLAEHLGRRCESRLAATAHVQSAHGSGQGQSQSADTD